jgi:hypothetical protein
MMDAAGEWLAALSQIEVLGYCETVLALASKSPPNSVHACYRYRV